MTTLILVALGFYSLGSVNVRAVTEPLPTLVIVPGQPFERFFPNVFDPFHEKELIFRGIGRIEIDPGAPDAHGTLSVVFDWIDPLTGGVVFSPPTLVDIAPNQPEFIDVSFVIPFCPPQVSLHLEYEGTPSVTIIEGVFIHECRGVPETLPNGFAAIVLLGLVGSHCAIRRHRVRA